MKYGRFLSALALLAVSASAQADPCRPEGRAAAGPEMRCNPAGGQGDPPARRSRTRQPGFETGIRTDPKADARVTEPLYVPTLPPPRRPAPEVRMPAPVTSCDPNGCYDSSGTRYSGGGPGMIRSDGKLCQQVGNMMHCN